MTSGCLIHVIWIFVFTEEALSDVPWDSGMDTEEESSYSGEEEEVCTLLGDPRETDFSWRRLCV
jgi:hypothetical protein